MSFIRMISARYTRLAGHVGCTLKESKGKAVPLQAWSDTEG